VPGGVELDLVDTVAVAIVGAQLRPVLVCQPAQRLRVPAAGVSADRGDPLLGPLRALATDRLDQRPIGLVDVVVDQGGRLVEDLVGLLRAWVRPKRPPAADPA